MQQEIIQSWFDMWIKKQDLGIDKIFASDIIYIECHGPIYENRKEVKKWFDIWNKDSSVLNWDIKEILYKDDKTVVLWHFKGNFKGKIDSFDGVSEIRWTKDKKISYVKEYTCKLPHRRVYKL